MIAALVITAAWLAADPAAAQSRWLKAESPRFIVYSDGDERVLREFTQQLEIFHDLLRATTAAKAGAPAPKLEIYLVADTRALRRVRPGASDMVGGFYTYSDEAIFAVAKRDRRDNSVLLHEYAHHFTYQYFPFGYPAWVTEGVAEYFSSAKFERDTVITGLPDQNRMDWLVDGSWLPWQRVVGGATWDLKNSDEVAKFYAQAWILTHYFLSDPERARRFTGYLRDVGEGEDSVEAMERALGAPISSLNQTIRSYLNSRTSTIVAKIDRSRIPDVTVTPLPPSARDLLLEERRLTRMSVPAEGAEREAALAELTTLRAAAARHPGDRLADLVLARIELVSEQPAAAAAVLNRRLDLDPNDVQALRLAARAAMAEGDAAEADEDRRAAYRRAQGFAGRAFRIDPTHWETLYLFFRSRSVERGFPTENDAEALLAAHEGAPQLPALRFQAAQVLRALGNSEYALHLLAPLAADPHSRGTAEQARKLMDAIREEMAGDGRAAK